MKQFIAILFFSTLLSIQLPAQFSESFDTDLSLWSGDVGDFVINSEGYLQLMASESGNSTIWSPVTFPLNWEFTINLRLEFAPSNNNKCRIYFLKSGPFPEDGNGYFLEIGENGSNDAIAVYSTTGGVSSLIARGTMGAVATDPVHVGISLARIQEGDIWVLKADYNGGTLYVPEIEYSDDGIDMSGEGYLAIECIYSSTRRDKFFVDNISIREFSEDIQPPQVINVEVVSASEILLSFDELIDEISGEDVENYLVEPLGYIPSNAMVDRNTVTLLFDQEFESGPKFSLVMEGVQDLSGNSLPLTEVRDLIYAVPPNPGDIFINEILFNPFPGEADYLEIYNGSSKAISLQNVEIFNQDNGNLETIPSPILLFPQSYVALSASIELVRERYNPPSTADLEQQELPAFNNDNGNVTLLYDGTLLDALDYSEDFHSPIISDPEGVSLERISTGNSSLLEDNWTSASSVNNFGTPGYRNGASITSINSQDILSMRSSSFSPNGDGHNDYMILDYNFGKPGYIANIEIFNDLGYSIKRLTNNVSLAANGFIQWDGVTDEGKVGRIGVYIVSVETFHPDGDIHQAKFAVVLVKDL